MELTRNHYCVIGLILLFFGIELRAVDSFVLTPEATNVLADRAGHPIAAVNNMAQSVFNTEKPLLPFKKTLQPPEWLGWALMSIGAVLVLHALSMPKPATG
jgi:hypothetical protein